MTQEPAMMTDAIAAAGRDGFYRWYSDPKAGAQRNASIVRAHRGGQALREIGLKFGLSYERVRQICERAKRRDPMDHKRRAPQLKAFIGWIGDDQVVIACLNQRAAAKRVGAPLYQIRKYFFSRESGDEYEIASQRPGTVFIWGEDGWRAR